MNLGLYPELTKSYILDRVAQEKIFERYLNVVVDLDNLISSPFRSDTNPSGSFYFSHDGRLRFNDFGTFHGDCFDAVGRVIGVNPKSKQGFHVVLHTIAKDFRIHKYKSADEVKNYYKVLNQSKFGKKKKIRKTYIKVRLRKWNKEDMKFWGKLINYDFEFLTKARTFPIDKAWVQKGDYPEYEAYSYHYTDPCYGYYYGKKDDRELWRLYFPFRETRRFLANNSETQFMRFIKPDIFGLITKSQKDCITYRSFGIISIAPPSEQIMIKRDDLITFNHMFDIKASNLDYDAAGIKMSTTLRDKYNIPPLMFKNPKKSSFPRKQKFLGAKDFSDLVNIVGRDQIKPVIEAIKEQEFQEIPQIINSFKFKL